jgi:hypothetical protein
VGLEDEEIFIRNGEGSAPLFNAPLCGALDKAKYGGPSAGRAGIRVTARLAYVRIGESLRMTARLDYVGFDDRAFGMPQKIGDRD